jgi:isoleucyl-tRNA synthetase
MTRLIAPVFSFTAEEIWKHVPENQKSGVRSQKLEVEKEASKADSIFFAGFPKYDAKYIDPELEKRWEKMIKTRDEANKALEIKRQEKLLGNALEAELTLHLPEDYYALLKDYEEFLPALFIVSKVRIAQSSGPIDDAYASPEISGMFIKVVRADGEKCERCWNRSTQVGSISDHPGICERCYRALE